MSGNLVDPLRNIAEGELSALGASFVLILISMLLLGASVDRHFREFKLILTKNPV